MPTVLMPQMAPDGTRNFGLWPGTCSSDNADLEEANAKPRYVFVVVEQELVRCFKIDEKIIWVEDQRLLAVRELDWNFGAILRHWRIHVGLQEDYAFYKRQLPTVIGYGEWPWTNIGNRERKHRHIQ